MIRIELHPDAPAKPPTGQPCNGCGICCATEPCPVAILFLWQRHGRCRALQWMENERRYVCGMVTAPAVHLRWLPKRCGSWAGRWFAKKIAADTCCDADIESMEPE